MSVRLQDKYKNEIIKMLIDKFKYGNPMEVPKLEKIVINMGVGEAVKDSKKIDAAVKELAAITGQKPIITKSKKANASFKLREGMPIGVKVTLRRKKMYKLFRFSFFTYKQKDCLTRKKKKKSIIKTCIV